MNDDIVNEYVLEWLRLADNDLMTARAMEEHRPKPLEIICFHCQQAVEKYLKSYLTSHDISPPKIHDLLELCNRCSEFDSEFSHIADRCKKLTLYAVHTRYPNEAYVDEAMAKEALEYAQQIKLFAPLGAMRKKAEGGE
jgi:HEPN domain-containing protein